jgi:hypothetical protein
MPSFVLGLTAFLCITMLAGATYIKHELDRAESVLAAPESALIGEQKEIEKLRRTLGFAGFVGSAQSFIASRDANLLADMRGESKAATEVINHLPPNMPPEMARDLQAILATFNAALAKAEKSASDPTAFTSTDIAPLYAALPVLDSRITAASGSQRLSAQDDVQFWALLLTVISWISLVIAAACATGIYFALYSRRSAPMRALAQSVRNMAQGDMRSSIWGMERADIIGELARSMDMARYQFSQMPDMSLLSDKGPVRIRFEGNTRSLFEAMMGMISKDAEQVRGLAKTLNEGVGRQQEVLTLLSSRVEAVLHNVEKRGLDGDRQVKDVLQNIISSAQSLRHAQEHASDQLTRIVPFLQERAQGIAEIAQITGKQVNQALQSLTLSERGFKSSSEQSDEAIKKLAATADDLGQRMFGAVNLLQASGKVLAETTETAQSRLNQAIDRISNGNITLSAAPPANDKLTGALTALAPRLEAAVATLESAQKRLEERIAEQKAAAAKMPDASAIAGAAFTPRVEAAIEAMENARKKLEERIAEQTQAAQAQINLLATQSGGLLTQTTTMTQTLSAAADHLRGAQSKFDETITGIASQLNDIGGRLEQKTEIHLGQTAERLRQEQTHFNEAVAAIASRVDALGSALERKTEDTFAKTSFHLREEQAQFNKAIGEIAGKLDELGGILEKKAADAFTQASDHLRKEQTNFGAAIGDISAKLEQLGHALKSKVDDAFGKTGAAAELSLQHLSTLTTQIDQMTEKMNALHTVSDAMEAVIAGAPKEPAFVGTIQANIQSGLATAAQEIGQLRGQLEAMSESVAKHATAPAAALMDRMQDHWYQTAAQIEATRASLEKAIAQQVSRIEARLGRIRENAAPGAPVELDDAARQQMEQQTQILAELVATMSLLDAHMQDIRSQMAEIKEKKAG